jgi:Relaxase/Mobilisation nuclease domain
MPAARTFQGQPLFDIASFARRGSGSRDRLDPAEVAQIGRTARRAPEVMVKVLSRGSDSRRSVQRHVGYIGRYGDLKIETDDGRGVQGNEAGGTLMDDWDLDLEEHRRQSDVSAVWGRKPPKLVHKLMLSMPPGTNLQAVLAGARNFLREEFALKHRYAFVLHTDEPHPHVHVVVKAMSEQGERLHIKKATLRAWRHQFALRLREQGVEANATERAVRGTTRASKLDGIYRATRDPRRRSTHMERKIASAADAIATGRSRPDSGKGQLLRTRSDVERGWHAAIDKLSRQGHPELAELARRFLGEMSPPTTEHEQLVRDLRKTYIRNRSRDDKLL